MNDQPNHLPMFIYGTLLPGETNYDAFLRGKTLCERKASVRGELYLAQDGDYPALLPGKEEVCGLLVELRPECVEETLQALDILEEYFPAHEEISVYLRRKAEIRLEDGTTTYAWVYFWSGLEKKGARIASGDFLLRSQGNKSA